METKQDIHVQMQDIPDLGQEQKCGLKYSDVITTLPLLNLATVSY